MKAFIPMEMRTLLVMAIVFFSAHTLADEPETPKLRPRLTLSEATTRVTGPLTKDGYIDYARVINQRLSVGVTAENNANVLIWKAMGPHPEGSNLGPQFFKLMKTEILPETGDYFAELNNFIKQELKLKPTDPRWNEIVDQQSEATSHLWTEQQYPNLAAWLKFNEKPLVVLREATLRPRYFSPLIVESEEDADALHGGLITALLPGVQSTRSFARALSARAMLHLANNRPEAAWEDILTCQRLGRLVAEGPTLVEALVGIAIGGMASDTTLVYIEHVNPDAEQSALLARQLEKLLPLPRMVDRIGLCERFMFLDITQRVAGTNGTNFELLINLVGNSGRDDNRFSRALTKFTLRLTDWDLVLTKGNEAYDQIIAALRVKDPIARRAAIDAFDRSISERAKQLRNPLKLLGRIAASESAGEGLGSVVGDIMISLLLPALSACQAAELRAFQLQDNLQVALALSAYHAEQGKYPATLAVLKPKYLKELPIDRFSGKALIYQPTQEGYLFYSVGRNEKDDQGRWSDDQPAGDDLRVRMPRKQPSKRD
ncbi:MAG: hypothetical protein VB862_10885 [Pirellulaceae bacterium]